MQVGCMYSAYPFLRHAWTDLDGLAWDWFSGWMNHHASVLSLSKSLWRCLESRWKGCKVRWGCWLTIPLLISVVRHPRWNESNNRRRGRRGRPSCLHRWWEDDGYLVQHLAASLGTAVWTTGPRIPTSPTSQLQKSDVQTTSNNIEKTHLQSLPMCCCRSVGYFVGALVEVLCSDFFFSDVEFM